MSLWWPVVLFFSSCSHNTKTTSWLDPRCRDKGSRPLEECDDDGKLLHHFYIITAYSRDICVLWFRTKMVTEVSHVVLFSVTVLYLMSQYCLRHAFNLLLISRFIMMFVMFRLSHWEKLISYSLTTSVTTKQENLKQARNICWIPNVSRLVRYLEHRLLNCSIKWWHL